MLRLNHGSKSASGFGLSKVQVSSSGLANKRDLRSEPSLGKPDQEKNKIALLSYLVYTII